MRRNTIIYGDQNLGKQIKLTKTVKPQTLTSMIFPPPRCTILGTSEFDDPWARDRILQVVFLRAVKLYLRNGGGGARKERDVETSQVGRQGTCDVGLGVENYI